MRYSIPVIMYRIKIVICICARKCRANVNVPIFRVVICFGYRLWNFTRMYAYSVKIRKPWVHALAFKILRFNGRSSDFWFCSVADIVYPI